MAASNRYPRQADSWDNRKPVRRPRNHNPANDNKPRPRPKPWIPANDNRPVPKPTDWALPDLPRVPGYRKWLHRYAKAFPWAGLGLTAWELYGWWNYSTLANPAEAGFKLVCTTNLPKIAVMWDDVSSGDVCGVGLQAVPANPTSPDDFVIPGGPGPTHYESIRYYVPNPAIVGRGTWAEIWVRDNRHSSHTPFTSWPPGTEWPDAHPKERQPPQPRYPPDHFPRIRPEDDPFINPGYPPLPPFPPPLRRPRDRPLLPEDRYPWYEPPARPRPEPRPRPRRPRKDERERKVRIKDMPNQRLRRVLGWLISAASEAGDFLDIMYGALPDGLQNSDADMSEKFDTVFKNLDKVDFDKFVSDLWQNEVQDRYFGKGFGDMTSALEEFGLELPSLKI